MKTIKKCKLPKVFPHHIYIGYFVVNKFKLGNIPKCLRITKPIETGSPK